MLSNHLRLNTNTGNIAVSDLTKLPHAQIEELDALLPKLASPDSGKEVTWGEGSETLTDGAHHYPLLEGMPLLLPERLHSFFLDRLSVPFDTGYDAFMQYFLLSSIKQSGEINASSDDVHYRRHLYRMREACKLCSGAVLDIGCDNPVIGASLLPDGSTYTGLDPFCLNRDSFRLIGTGEFLPFKAQSFDAVLYNTSLDHMLDWRSSLDEAKRVLVPGGRLVISTLVWDKRATLITDLVHFHHFREYEILGALVGFEIDQIWRHDYKGDDHRYGLYLSAIKKPERQ